jgi:hypothetical protein
MVLELQKFEWSNLADAAVSAPVSMMKTTITIIKR